MRQETINIFFIHELSDNAKQKAHQEYLNRGDYWHWGSEAVDSLKEFCKLFNLRLNIYSLDSTLCTVDVRTEHIDDAILNIKGVRLMAYLHNKYYNSLFRRKIITRSKAVGDGITAKRYSKCTMEQIDCPLTGYCEDDTLLAPIISFMQGKTKKHFKNTTFEDLINESISEYCTSVKADIENSESLDYFIDHAEANDYEYYEDGTMY